MEDHSALKALSLRELRQVFRENGPYHEIYKIEGEDGEKTGHKDFGHIIITLEYYCQSFIFLLQNTDFAQSALLQLLFAVSGYFFKMMYAFQLMLALMVPPPHLPYTSVQLPTAAVRCRVDHEIHRPARPHGRLLRDLRLQLQ